MKIFLFYFFNCDFDSVGGPFFEPANDYYHTHDPLGYIGTDRNTTVAAHSMYVPPSMFNVPQPPAQHYQVSHQSIHPSSCYHCKPNHLLLL